MILVDEPSLVVHRVVVFNEYLYILALRVGAVRKVTLRKTGYDLKKVAEKMYAEMPENLKGKLHPHQTRIIGKLMRGEIHA